MALPHFRLLYLKCGNKHDVSLNTFFELSLPVTQNRFNRI